VSAFDAVALVESDTAIIPTTRALYIATGGTVAVTMNSGRAATFLNVPQGTILPIQITKVLVASTATGLALY